MSIRRIYHTGEALWLFILALALIAFVLWCPNSHTAKTRPGLSVGASGAGN